MSEIFLQDIFRHFALSHRIRPIVTGLNSNSLSLARTVFIRERTWIHLMCGVRF
jgi:hypothetical protein